MKPDLLRELVGAVRASTKCCACYGTGKPQCTSYDRQGCTNDCGCYKPHCWSCKGSGVKDEATHALLTRAESALPLSGTYTWVPVGERLPEVMELYSVALQGQPNPCIAAYFGGRWMWYRLTGPAVDLTESVTHWAEPLLHPSELGKEGL